MAVTNELVYLFNYGFFRKPRVSLGYNLNLNASLFENLYTSCLEFWKIEEISIPKIKKCTYSRKDFLQFTYSFTFVHKEQKLQRQGKTEISLFQTIFQYFSNAFYYLLLKIDFRIFHIHFKK